MTIRFSLLFVALSLFLVGGCGSHKTPSEVADAFWRAVVANDTAKVRKYVAEGSLQDFDLLSNKEGALKGVEVGEALVKGDRAEVKTTLIGEKDGKETRLPVTTFLVRQQDRWKVDGQQSVNALVATSVNLMMNDIGGNIAELGQALSNSISGGLQAFITSINQQVPAIKQELSQLSDEEKTREIGRKLGELFSAGLKDAMKQLNQGLDEMAKEIDKAASQQAKPAQQHTQPAQ